MRQLETAGVTPQIASAVSFAVRPWLDNTIEEFETQSHRGHGEIRAFLVTFIS
jgi:hypothetical protein